MADAERKTVVVMYPDQRTTGVDERILPYSSLCRGIRAFTSVRLQHYREHHRYPVIGVVYDDTFPGNISPLYPRELFDKFVSIGVDFDDWKQNTHRKQLECLVPKFLADERAESVLVTGYHIDYCVRDMQSVLVTLGHRVAIDHVLTDELPALFIEHEVNRRLG